MATVRLETELPVRTASNACPPSWIKVTKILNGYVRIPANGMNHKAMDRRTAKNKSIACGRASVLILYLIFITTPDWTYLPDLHTSIFRPNCFWGKLNCR